MSWSLDRSPRVFETFDATFVARRCGSEAPENRFDKGRDKDRDEGLVTVS
jgi:hypothetical protein